MLINKLKSIITVLMMLFFATADAQSIEMADGLRASGKIYVVVGVVLIVFAGIVAFLIHLERKLRQLEQQNVEK